MSEKHSHWKHVPSKISEILHHFVIDAAVMIGAGVLSWAPSWFLKWLYQTKPLGIKVDVSKALEVWHTIAPWLLIGFAVILVVLDLYGLVRMRWHETKTMLEELSGSKQEGGEA